MKQVQQNYRSGELTLVDVPAPQTGAGALLVASRASLISPGTERQLLQLAKSSLIGKAAARPDLVRKVIADARRLGVRPTLQKVFTRLDTPIPLGYSLVGEVVEIGRRVEGFALGQRVACAGAALANHAEFNAIPKNLCAAAPEGVDDEDASFVTLGAIALQGVRLAAPTLGERVAVLGLGLIGLLTVQILKANGCFVIGADPDAGRVAQALAMGADAATRDALPALVAAHTEGHGADAVIVTASTPSNEPVNTAASISRKKGRVVVVGLVGLQIEREAFYKRELDLKVAMSYGPGRGDPDYEQGGHDYPLAYVRWTEKRNMQAFLELVAAGRVTPKKLITHRFAIADAERAYELIESGTPHMGIVLTYPAFDGTMPTRAVPRAPRAVKAELGVAFVGLGNYAKSSLLPEVTKAKGATLTAVVTSTAISAGHSAKKYGFAVAATAPEAAFDDAATDVVFIATRHDTHADLATRALQAGKHVFCEKPLALDEASLARVMAAALAAPGLLTVGFNRRFAPLLVQAKAALEPRTGPLLMLYRVNAGVVPADSWVTRGEGGGRILGEACHFVDALSYLCGAAPVSAQAVAARGLADGVTALLTFADGSTGTILYAPQGDPGVPKEYCEIFASGRIVRLDDFTKLTINVDGKERIVTARQDKGQAALVAAFLAAAKSGGPAPIPLADLAAVSEATLAIERALRGEGDGDAAADGV